MRYDIQLPDNKSLRIREMVFSYAMGNDIPPLRDGDCHDVQVTHRALRTLSMPSSVRPVVVNVEDCGAAYRFLMPLLAATPGRWLLTGTPRLLQRPISPLVDVLRGIGVDIERVEDGWLILGKQFRSVETRHGTSLRKGIVSLKSASRPLPFQCRHRYREAHPPKAKSGVVTTVACT